MRKHDEEAAKAKAEQDAKDAEEKVKREAEALTKAEAMKPDREKLIMFADKINHLSANNLDVKSDEARELFHITLHKIMDVEKNFRSAIEVL